MISKKKDKYLVKDSSGKRTLGEHESRKEALRQLRAIEASKADHYADGGSKPSLSPEEVLRLKERLLNVTPTTKKTFTAQEAENALSMGKTIAEQYPQLKNQVMETVQKSLSKNPLRQQAQNLNADLSNLNAVVSGANPHLDQSQLIKGSPEIIDDINKIPGGTTPNVPESVSKFSTPVDRFDTSGMKSIKGSDFAKRQLEEKVQRQLRDDARYAAKKAGLQALKGTSKKLLSALPLVGGVAAALSSGDASAAMPMGFESEELGAPKDSIEGKMERGERLSPEDQTILEERIKALEALRNR